MLFHRLKRRQLKQMYAKGHWHPELELAITRFALSHPSADNLLLYTAIKHSLTGFSADEIQHTNQIADESGAATSPALRLRLLALKFEHDNAAPANELPDILSLANHRCIKRYPTLLRHLKYPENNRSTYNQSHNQLIIQAIDFCNRLHPATSYFANQTPGTQVAIVGNSPIEKGRELGQEIDRADIVFRFNHVVVDESHRVDYGEKSHAWVISPSYKFNQSDVVADHIFVSGSAPFHKPTQYWQRLAALSGVQFYTFSRETWYQLVNKLNAPPSAGLLCLTDVMQTAAAKLNVKAYGINTDDTISQLNHYGDRGMRSSRHNWKLEVAEVRRLLTQ